MTIARDIFEGGFAESRLHEAMNDADIPFERLSWDWYDDSLELHGVPSEFRLSETQLKALLDAGFSKVYINHCDNWETHYSEKNLQGWRVSYPHKRDDSNGIWVETFVDSWPKEWFETGYAKVVAK